MTNTSQAKPNRLLTVAAVAEQLSVSQRQVRRWIATGELPAHRLGRLTRIDPRDLELFLRDRRIVQAGRP